MIIWPKRKNIFAGSSHQLYVVYACRCLRAAHNSLNSSALLEGCVQLSSWRALHTATDSSTASNRNRNRNSNCCLAGCAHYAAFCTRYEYILCRRLVSLLARKVKLVTSASRGPIGHMRVKWNVSILLLLRRRVRVSLSFLERLVHTARLRAPTPTRTLARSVAVWAPMRSASRATGTNHLLMYTLIDFFTVDDSFYSRWLLSMPNRTAEVLSQKSCAKIAL